MRLCTLYQRRIELAAEAGDRPQLNAGAVDFGGRQDRGPDDGKSGAERLAHPKRARRLGPWRNGMMPWCAPYPRRNWS